MSLLDTKTRYLVSTITACLRSFRSLPILSSSACLQALHNEIL